MPRGSQEKATKPRKTAPRSARTSASAGNRSRKKSQPPTPSSVSSKTLEPLFLLAALRQRAYYLQVGAFVGPEYFQGDLFYVRQALDDYWKGAKKTEEASLHHLRLLTKRRCGEKRWESVRHVLAAMEDQPTHLPKNVEDAVVEYVEREGQKRWALEVLQEADRGVHIPAGQSLRRLRDLTRGFGPRVRGHAFSQNTPDFKSHLSRSRVSTGMAQVDYALHGGLGAGDLGVIVAPWAGGKTTALVHLGAAAAEAGHRVLHISLEIPEWQVDCRYVQRLGGLTLDDVLSSPKRVSQVKRQLKGEVEIRDYSHQSITTEFLEGILGESERLPDVLLVDYAALMRSSRGTEGRRFEVAAVFTDLRRIASAFGIPVWTAHQATREASKSGDISGNDVAEDISVSQTVDVMICMMERKWMIEKTRLPRTGAERLIRIEADTDRQVYREVVKDGAKQVHNGRSETGRQVDQVAQKAIRAQSTGSRRKSRAVPS